VSLMMKMDFKVSDRGELVAFELAGFKASFEFADALGLSALLRREARFAKASTGARGWQNRMHGVLTDAGAPKWKQSRWSRLPDLLRLKKMRAYCEGQIVCLRIGSILIKLPYDAAFELAQAFRVHGKLARNFAGEKAHWVPLAETAMRN
jgi:hypothetical protein